MDKKIPLYRLHKASGQGVCWIAGRTYYLGKHNSPESLRQYNTLLARYLSDPSFGVEKSTQSIAESVVSYLRYAKDYYRQGDEYSQICRACKPLVDTFGSCHLSEFGVQIFKAYREHWVRKQSSRGYVNKQCRRILQMVEWWIAEEYLDATVLTALQCVKPLRQGHTTCPEARKVKPIADSVVDATIKHLPKILQDMVNLHRSIGCRPGEICRLKPSLINTQSEVWTIKLEKHKNAWRGHDRTIFIGPKGQAILKPYLETCKPDEYIFSPKVAVEQRLAKRESERTTSKSCGNRRGTNRVRSPKTIAGDCYNAGSYGHFIAYACIKAKVPKWTPNQLRHSVGTKLREIEGIESASVILGHRHLPTTEIYAQASTKRAIEVAKKHG
jgi:integrase